MADIKYYDVILKPIITEKSMDAMSEKKYTFLVHTEATKSQIKEAVEKMFAGTKVKSVNTMNYDERTKDAVWWLERLPRPRKRSFSLPQTARISSCLRTVRIRNYTPPTGVMTKRRVERR